MGPERDGTVRTAIPCGVLVAHELEDAMKYPTVGSVMTSPVITVSPDTPFKQAAASTRCSRPCRMASGRPSPRAW